MKQGMMTIIALFLAVGVWAQQGKDITLTPEEKAAARTQKMIDEGLLNTDKYDEAYAIHLEGAKEMDAMRAEQRQAHDKMKTEKRALMEEKATALESLMTEEQKEQFELKKAQRQLKKEEKALRHRKRHLKQVEKTKMYLHESGEE